MTDKLLVIIGGPSGSGKTTALTQLQHIVWDRPNINISFVDTDKVTSPEMVAAKCRELGAQVDTPSYLPVSRWRNARTRDTVRQAFNDGARVVILASPSLDLGPNENGQLEIDQLRQDVSPDNSLVSILVLYVLLTATTEIAIRTIVESRIRRRLTSQPEYLGLDGPKLSQGCAFYSTQSDRVRKSVAAVADHRHVRAVIIELGGVESPVEVAGLCYREIALALDG